jgi:hypothetical protein
MERGCVDIIGNRAEKHIFPGYIILKILIPAEFIFRWLF